jgi:hypothetical protein
MEREVHPSKLRMLVRANLVNLSEGLRLRKAKE